MNDPRFLEDLEPGTCFELVKDPSVGLCIAVIEYGGSFDRRTGEPIKARRGWMQIETGEVWLFECDSPLLKSELVRVTMKEVRGSSTGDGAAV